MKIDECYWECKCEKARLADRHPMSTSNTKQQNKPRDGNNQNKGNSNNSGNPKSTKQPNTQKPTGSAPINKAHLGNNGKLTPQERQRRYNANLCLFCGGPGHRVNDCPCKSKDASAASASVGPGSSSQKPKR